MKKILLFVICALFTFSFAGCMAQNGPSLETVQTSNAPDASKINANDYDNNLKGLEKYFYDIGYLPEKPETEMMYKVIGAIAGDRYHFIVNSSAVYVELYEYDPKNLNDDGKRVIEEVKKDGKFYVFKNNNNGNVAYEATLSDNGKYLMIYTDNSSEASNVQRKTDVINALKNFNK